jgi:hypothetical protein
MPFKTRLCFHGGFLLLAWFIGPFFAAWSTEFLVAMGMRGNFTYLDPLWRLMIYGLFELAFYVTYFIRNAENTHSRVEPIR